jgi:hypothetical protein
MASLAAAHGGDAELMSLQEEKHRLTMSHEAVAELDFQDGDEQIIEARVRTQ